VVGILHSTGFLVIDGSIMNYSGIMVSLMLCASTINFDPAEFVITRLPHGVPAAARVDRLEQFRRVHPGSTIYVSTDKQQGVCVLSRPGKTVFLGFTRDLWVNAFWGDSDWRRHVSNYYLREVAELSRIETQVATPPPKCSSFKLKDGARALLPARWSWSSERQGLWLDGPDDKLMDLDSHDIISLVEVHSSVKSRARGRSVPSPFTDELLNTGREVYRPKLPEMWKGEAKANEMVGLSFRLKEGWVVVFYARNAVRNESLVLKLLESLRAQLQNR